MKYIFIVNPTAGKKSCEEWLRNAISQLDSDFCKENTVEIKLTEYQGHAGEIAAEAAKSGEPVRIYACGGDGTLSEVINGVYGFANCEVGVLPVGTGNDFVKTVAEDIGEYGKSFYESSFSDIKAQLFGESRATDLLETCGKYSINVICAGFDADAAAGVHSFSRLPLISGKMAYKISVLKCLISHMKHDFKLIADGKELPKQMYLLTVAANAKYYGGGYKCAPEADTNDGLIDFLYVPTISRLKFLKLVGYYEKGEHLEKLDICELIRCKTLQICSDKEIELSVDGEILAVKDPVIRIIKDAVKIIYPLTAKNS